MNDRSGQEIAAVSSEALLKHIGPHTIGMVDTGNREMPLSSGVLIQIADHVFIATAKHCIPGSPNGRLWVLPGNPRSHAKGMLGFSSIERHESLDLGVLEVDPVSLAENSPGKSPLKLTQVQPLGIGRKEKPMGICGCPVQFYSGEGSATNPGRALMNFYLTTVMAESEFPTVPNDARPVDISLRHNAMQHKLFDRLTAKHGEKNVGTENETGNGTRIDAIVKTDSGYLIYEIKPYQSPRACIRDALGQLLEYAHWKSEFNAIELVVVGPGKLDTDPREYLDLLRYLYHLPISYLQIAV